MYVHLCVFYHPCVCSQWIIAIQMLKKASRWSHRWLFRAAHGHLAQIMLIDTSLATLILDGELWTRSPMEYCHYRPEVVNLPQDVASEENTNLRRSLIAHDLAASLRDPTTHWRGDLRVTPTVIMELTRARQVMLMFNTIIVWHSDVRNFSMQYRDNIWCPINKFFEKERGGTIKNSHVDKILGRFRQKLEERQSQFGPDDDKEGIVLDIVLSGLDPLNPPDPPSLQMLKSMLRVLPPGLAYCFLVTNDSISVILWPMWWWRSCLSSLYRRC